jgi:hypothetical protein
MTDTAHTNLVIVVSTPRDLTKEQRGAVRVEVQSQLPEHAIALVLDGGFAVDAIPVAVRGDAGPDLDFIAGELARDLTPALILAELKALRAEVARAHERRQPLSTRIASDRIKL